MSKHPATELRETYAQQIPSTSKISEGIEKTKEAIHEEVTKRSPLAPEQKVGKDTEQLLETTQHFLEEKNKGDVLQKLILDANKATDELTVLFQKHPFFIEKHKALMAKHEALDLANVARTNLSMMRDLLLTLVNSSEFRGLINDFISLVQEMVQRETSGAPSLTPSSTTTSSLTEEYKQKGEQLMSVAKQVASDVQQGTVPVPEDKKQSIQLRFKNLVHNLSRDPNYINSVNGIFQIMDQAQFLLQNIKEEAQGRVQEIQTPSLNAMWLDSKQFLINFAGEAPVNQLISDWSSLYDVILSDTLLMNFMDDFRTFILDILKNPEMVDSAEFNVRWDDLYMRGQGYLNDPRYTDKFNQVYKDIMVLMDSIRMDTTTQQLANDASKLARDLFLDESGKPSLNIMSSGLNNLRSLVGPILKKNLENVPISGISGEDETYKWKIDHLLLNMTNLVPDNIEVRVWGAANVSIQSTEAQAITYITMWIKNVGVEAKDMKFAFQRKTFPKIEDAGIADFSISGRNELKITWKVAGQQNEPWVFSLYQVKCNLDNVDITVKESHHSFLMKLMTTLFRGTIRRTIEDNIEKNISEGLGTVNDQLNAAVKA